MHANRADLSQQAPKKNNFRVSRRAFLATSVLTGGAVVLAAIPIVSTVVLPSLKKGVGKWIDFGKADKLAADDFSMLSYEFMVKDGWQDLPQRGFVWAKADDKDDVKVFSSTCSHLACSVIWNKDRRMFLCPCHSGLFDPNGQPAGGPPKKPLTLLPHKIEEGKLLVHITL
jgi:menaquinol-cytochrome c reductase iron-sulfur subunit